MKSIQARLEQVRLEAIEKASWELGFGIYLVWKMEGKVYPHLNDDI
jgi:hypothetical protein